MASSPSNARAPSSSPAQVGSCPSFFSQRLCGSLTPAARGARQDGGPSSYLNSNVQKVATSVTKVVYTTKVVYIPVLINYGSLFDFLRFCLPVNGEPCDAGVARVFANIQSAFDLVCTIYTKAFSMSLFRHLERQHDRRRGSEHGSECAPSGDPHPDASDLRPAIDAL